MFSKHAKKHNVKRIIHTSTSEVYGSAQYVPINEKHPIVAHSPYSASKIAADKLVESYYSSYGTPITIVRPFNTFGPRQSMRAIIPTIMVQALTNQTLSLGNLDPVRDLTYVEDTVNGFIAALWTQKAVGETINLGIGKGISIRDLVKKISELIGKNLTVKTDVSRLRPEKSEVAKLISDNTKAKEILSWHPHFELVKGLSKTLEYVESNLHKFRPDYYSI